MRVRRVEGALATRPAEEHLRCVSVPRNEPRRNCGAMLRLRAVAAASLAGITRAGATLGGRSRLSLAARRSGRCARSPRELSRRRVSTEESCLRDARRHLPDHNLPEDLASGRPEGLPTLAKMARQHLGRPASSAGVERMFSKAGRLHDDLKASQLAVG